MVVIRFVWAGHVMDVFVVDVLVTGSDKLCSCGGWMVVISCIRVVGGWW